MKELFFGNDDFSAVLHSTGQVRHPVIGVIRFDLAQGQSIEGAGFQHLYIVAEKWNHFRNHVGAGGLAYSYDSDSFAHQVVRYIFPKALRMRYSRSTAWAEGSSLPGGFFRITNCLSAVDNR